MWGELVRDIDELATRPFDLLVIGGGIAGLMAAWEGTSRGLRVALIDKGDFGSGASFHHHRTLHGGLRYLQRGDIPRLRESMRERRAWARIAPQFIAPQAFAVATDRGGTRSSRLMRLGFLADALFSVGRNRGVSRFMRLRRGRVTGGAEAAELDTGDLLPTGPLALWYDYLITHPERLTLAVALKAMSYGATLANYVEAVEPLRSGRKVGGVIARDGIDGERVTIRARVTLNAAGAGAGRVMAGFGVRRSLPLVKAMNLVTTLQAPRVACGAPTAGGRLLFALPFQGRLSIGTWHGAELCGADAGFITAEEFSSFLHEIDQAFPALGLTGADTAFVQRGIVPARVVHGRVDLADRPLLREHRQDGVDGAITMVGVKYTTARALAERAVTLAMAQIGCHAPSRTASVRLVEYADHKVRCPTPDIDGDAWGHLQRVYGENAARVAALAKSEPALAQRIVPTQPIIAAQVVEAVRHEMAQTLEDVVLRRTGLGSAGYPGDGAILTIERILRSELGWTSSRVEDEVQLLKESYLPLHV